jgi:hypothetical protein
MEVSIFSKNFNFDKFHSFQDTNESIILKKNLLLKLKKKNKIFRYLY